jgi:hypothetical protein
MPTKADELAARLDRVEKKLDTLVEGLQFAANQLRPVFGHGAHLAAIFDEIAKKAKEAE